MRVLPVTAVFVAALAAAARAQTEAGVQQASETQATSSLGVFAHLTGEWEGDAWMLTPGGRHEARQWEKVEVHAGGTVIAVKGVGTEKVEAGEPRVVHDAFAIIHLDRDGRTPRMRAFIPGGRWVDADLMVLSDGYDWSMSDPRAGRIRYEMRVDGAGRWVERGFASRDDGKTWMQFMEMTLTRKP